MTEENRVLNDSKFLVFLKIALLGESLVCSILLIFSLISIILIFLQIEPISTDLLSLFIPPDSTPIETILSFLGIISLTLGGIIAGLGGIIVGLAAGQSSMHGMEVVPYSGLHLDEIQRLHKAKVNWLFKNADLMLLGVFLFFQGLLLILCVI